MFKMFKSVYRKNCRLLGDESSVQPGPFVTAGKVLFGHRHTPPPILPAGCLGTWCGRVSWANGNLVEESALFLPSSLGPHVEQLLLNVWIH